MIGEVEYARRREALLAALDADAWIAYGDDRQFAGADHVRYLTGLQPHFEGVLVVGGPGFVDILTGPETVGYAENSVGGIDAILPIEEMAHPGLAYRSIALSSGVARLADRLRDARVVGLLGGDRIPSPLFAALLSGLALVDAEEVAYALRAIKTADEQALIDSAFAIAAEGMRAAASALRAGATEAAVAGAAEARMREAGAEGFGIDAMVASGATHSRTILARSTAREIVRGDAVAITLCPRFEGYHACLARAFTVGPGPELEDHLGAAREAQRAALSALRVGSPGGGAVPACDAVLSARVPEAEIRDVWVHSTGMVEFEPPVFTAGTDTVLRSGMAFNIDVPIFAAPWGGLRLEDGFSVTDHGIRPRLPDADTLVPVEV
jgi:Xaa-Pro aminopeptidase